MITENITHIENTILSNLPAPQRKEFQTAMTHGTSTELHIGAPESHVDGLPTPYYCSDCNTWHLLFTGLCVDVLDGELTVFTWHADEDGDWEFVPVGDITCYGDEANILFADHTEALREYREDGDGSLDHLI